MRKPILPLMSLAALAVAGLAAVPAPEQPALQGFFFGNATAPGGHEWESPESLAYNKELPRAVFFTFADTESAKQVLPGNGAYHISLDGQWKFNWVPVPSERPQGFQNPSFDVASWDSIPVPSSWNIVGIQPDGSQKYGTPIYVNQPVIFQHKVAVDDWRGGVMRTPPENWTTYKHRNEVGSYRRDFTVPKDWDGRETYINFDGVDSFFYLWINGQYVGFSKNSRNAARFDITKYLRPGVNTVAVEVYRNSDGSFLEAQDMFRLPGIFRSVYLTSTSKTQIRDLVAIPDLDGNYRDGILDLKASVRNLGNKAVKNCRVKYSLFANPVLYSDSVSAAPVATAESAPVNLTPGLETTLPTVLKLADPKKWSAEQPWRYTLVATLTDAKGKALETVSTYVGFRKVEVKEVPASEDEFGLAGRYMLVNGKPVKLKGVNRHETSPSRGHAITPEQMEEEVMLMKRANINHVRNSHYPDHPYWYYLADKYGIYLEDEANLESHEYYYGKASLSHVPEWEPAHVARNMEMVHARVNSPAIVIWSLGNEAGPGKNFETAYAAIKDFDTSRPVQYERNNDIVDIGSNQYPSIAWVQEGVKGKMGIKYPFHISEYAHSMGNAVGGLADYWKAIESTNFFMGGAIWDWVDQSLYNYDPETGDRYLAFGGDFGDTPSDGQFVMNGIVFGDLQPKPQYWEVKKVYQNVGVDSVDMAGSKVRVFNKNYFKPLDDMTMRWSLLNDGVVKESGTVNLAAAPVAPRTSAWISLPAAAVKAAENADTDLRLEFILNEDMPWAPKGYVQMAEQLPISQVAQRPSIAEVAKGTPLVTLVEGDRVKIAGPGVVAVFNMNTGTLESLAYNGVPVMIEGQGPQLDAFRAYMNNDNWVAGNWFANGLYNLKHVVKNSEIFTDANGNPVLSFTIESQAPRGGKMIGNNGNSRGTYSIQENEDESFGPDDFKFTTNQTWTIWTDGSIELNAAINSNNSSLVLPRLGYTMEVPSKFSSVTYYGRGPEENYSDRMSGQFKGLYTLPLSRMISDYTRPQSNGNREDVDWAVLSDGKSGIAFNAPEGMSFSVLPWTEMEIFKADHPYKLPKSDRIVVHLDYGQTGLGGASCGQGGPLDHQRVKAGPHRFAFLIRPVSATGSDVTGAGVLPLSMSRDRLGRVTIEAGLPDATILYTIDGKNPKKPLVYTGPFELRQGGTVKAWLMKNPKVQTTETYSKIEAVKAEVIFGSSEEPDYGEASNLTDGDPSTIWHTMYSVTVAVYPHWVDFDAGENRAIKGVRYMPRQDGNRTGNVKDYEVYVSTDGKEWGEPVAKGTFDSSAKAKIVTFPTPVKGRYVRFKALSAQDGRDYASGSEFEIIAD